MRRMLALAERQGGSLQADFIAALEGIPKLTLAPSRALRCARWGSRQTRLRCRRPPKA
ncbi:hypothetical protein ULG90_11255 [Halopseudomonas pachastrellae]|nr:hypothetical protein ULG90_11255 [Halopseudomonas pachastrellae]